MKQNSLFLLILFMFAGLMALGMNSYLIPGYYDNALYYSLGRSLFFGEPYQFLGKYIVDWPPVFPAILAFSFTLFGESVLTAKITTAFFALLGLTAVYALIRKEERPYPLLTVFFMSLLPVGLAMGTRIAPEWLFITLSFAFLYLVETMRVNRSVSLSVLAGLLLGFASTTRYIGVLLGVALIAQCWLIYREEGKGFIGKIIPEVVTALIGAFIFLGWIANIAFQVKSETVEIQTGNYEKFGLSIFSYLNFTEMSEGLTDLLFQGNNISEKFQSSGIFILLVSYAVFFIIAIGFVRQIKSKKIKASDFYVLATLIALTFYEWKLSRYLLTLFPFLFSYFIQGGEGIFSRIKYIILASCWVVVLLAIDAHILFIGNGTAFNGLSPLVSSTGSDFYRGEWAYVYEESDKIPNNPPCSVGVDPDLSGYVKYIHAWTGCEIFIGNEQEKMAYDHYIDKP